MLCVVVASVALAGAARSAGHDPAVQTAPATATLAATENPSGGGFFTDLFRLYTPRRLCMREEPAVIRLHLVTDGLIALAYFTIPVALVRFARRRTDLAYNWMFVCFAVFILACGMTHVMNIVAIYAAVYRVDGLVKAVTAVASVGTAAALWKLVPVALLVPSPAQLRAANQQLAAEVVERKRAEEELRRARDELEQRVRDRTAELTTAHAAERAARAEAERTGRMKDEFLSTLSHELRTPLNAVLGWSQILKKGRGDPVAVERGLDVIERNARAQARIIDDLLDMSRIISGKVRLELLPIDLRALVADAIETHRPTAQARGVTLRCHADVPGDLTVLADADRVRQILWNLLSNAIKFTPRDGRIDVRLDLVDQHARLRVTDTGQGIDPAFLPFVFERFRQADSSTTRQHAGLGLGLSIVKQLVELHGGTIRAESDGPGRGASFEVMFPLRTTLAPRSDESTLDVAAASIPAPAEPPPGPVRLDGVRVLAVDDEPDARELLRHLLETAHARVTLAGNAHEAWQLLGRQPFDVLISDIGMPEENGYSLIHRIRTQGAEPTRRIPAIALTAYARTEDRIRAITAGFQTHLTKPINPSELLAVLAATVGRIAS